MKVKHARLLFLERALESLSTVIFAADEFLSPKHCDALSSELEPLVRSMTTKIEARIPELVLPVTLGNDSRIDELVEMEMAFVTEQLLALNATIS